MVVAALVSCLLHAGLLLVPGKVGVGSEKYAPSMRFTVTQGRRAAPPQLAQTPAPNEKPAPDLPAPDQQLPGMETPYYASKQLNKHPQPLEEPNLDTTDPNSAQIAGTVVLQLWINASGEVVQVQVKESNMPASITSAAVATFQHLGFVPGELFGHPVGSVMTIEVNYGNAIPSGAAP